MIDNPKEEIFARNLFAQAKDIQTRKALAAAAANGGEGWVYHQDNAKADRADGVDIAEGVRTQITIDGMGPNCTDNLDTIPRPRTGTPLLSNGKFMPCELNDNYLIRFGFMAAIIDPGLSNTEELNSIQIEFDVGGSFNVHEASTIFNPDPGPVRMDRNNWNAASGLGILTSLVAPRLTILNALISAAVAHQNNTGQKFIEFGQAFAGQSVLDNGVAFYVTPSTDIRLWAPDVTITRLSSPTL